MRYWKANEHWMIRDADSDPTFDPQPSGCTSCGWCDDRGVEVSNLIWNPGDETNRYLGWWLCMECD